MDDVTPCVWHCVAVCYSVLQFVAGCAMAYCCGHRDSSGVVVCCRMLQCFAVYVMCAMAHCCGQHTSRVLRCVAVCCSVLQCILRLVRIAFI